MSDWKAAIEDAHRVLDGAAEGLHRGDWDALATLTDFDLPSTSPAPDEAPLLAGLLARISGFQTVVAGELEKVGTALQSTRRVEAANRAYLSS